MTSRFQYGMISTGLVACMIGVAWGESQHGAELSDIHLITPAPLVPASTVHVMGNTGAVYHNNTITEALYFEPPETTPLPLDGVTHPRPAAFQIKLPAH